MNSFSCLILIALALIGCRRKEDPEPTLIGSTWSLQTQVVTYTPKNGGVATTHPRPIAPGSITYFYGVNGQFSMVNFGVLSTGTYIYSNGLITIPSVNGSQSHLFTVTQLTAHQLVTVETSADNNYQYDDTITYSR